MELDIDSALVLFSGGQDSTTCLGWALNRFSRIETLGFSYNQRHSVELECRELILESIQHQYDKWATRLGLDHLIDVPALADIGKTAMTEELVITADCNGLPNTFVPGRNILFLTFAAALAYRRGIKHIITGVCETDFSGYPDCRDDTIKALQVAINLGMESRFKIEAPLMWMDKSATWALAEEIGGKEFINLIINQSHTCYKGDRSLRWEWGFGCGDCPACGLRASGWMLFQER
ncbi:7-cyano-7-deazaguanine synthase QueC [Methylophaga pinxianii]|uniref:7-cyano-7-deazaguanine synthase QueC n=1 Tax=Methylophaga pinxianii TaxID=2881052 RepID=UPI001CF3283D|nr:7-cyano-7-deazaguanine synthase QueC [Methylophaga pinxianii]MCB2427120.1 7-cyano-7-deazaguanine synthase QueC [Methylophaga pinxianii]UPH44977.1 7-cyano-7-deazaguanine synthase QueC [Methylophaga pinxianii]